MQATKDKTISFRIATSTNKDLSDYSKHTRQSKSEILNTATIAYLEYMTWQDEQIKLSLKEIANGEVITLDAARKIING